MVRCSYEVVVGDLSFEREVLGGVNIERVDGLGLALHTLNISAPLSQKALGSTPAFAAAL